LVLVWFGLVWFGLEALIMGGPGPVVLVEFFLSRRFGFG